MSAKLTINDLSPELQERVRQQAADEGLTAPKQAKHTPQKGDWQGKEIDLQHRVEAWLAMMGFCKRTGKAIERTGSGMGRRGVQLHFPRAIGNPYMLDILLLGRDGRWLELELKNAKGKLSDLQRILTADDPGRVCRSVEAVQERVESWLAIPARRECHDKQAKAQTGGGTPSAKSDCSADDPRIYACDHCGRLRNKAEGGNIFTLCDVCWYKHFQKPNAAGQGRREATYPEPVGSASLVAQPPRDVSELYHELLYAVGQKFPGESRHETALRYIRDTEVRVSEAGSCKQNAEAHASATEGRR